MTNSSKSVHKVVTKIKGLSTDFKSQNPLLSHLSCGRFGNGRNSYIYPVHRTLYENYTCKKSSASQASVGHAELSENRAVRPTARDGQLVICNISKK
eukprot:3080551-Rhodomonas_salina.1